MRDFWKQLKKPFFVLAPMADVTDSVFREIIAKYGKPHVFVTEFTSADGLMSAGREKLMHNLRFTQGERPIIAQFFSAKPEQIKGASALARERGFDGVDINMGCPDRAVVKQGAGGALIRTPKLARELIRAAKEGAVDIPVSVKTRLGFNKDTLEEWLPELLAEHPAVVTIHARTVKELSKVPARWERIRDAVAIRDSLGSETLIVGNGDVANLADARRKAEETGADGVMLGRAIFGNPWLFSESGNAPNEHEKLRVLVEHANLFETYFKDIKSFAVMKKHFKAYVNGFDGARDLRIVLMEGDDTAESVRRKIHEFLDSRK